MKTKSIIIGSIIGVLLLGTTFFAGIIFGANLVPAVPSPLAPFSLLTDGSQTADNPFTLSDVFGRGGTPDDLDEEFESFWKAWGLVHEEFVAQPVDDEALVQGAIEGMLESLDDPYTNYLDAESYDHFFSQFEGGYSGIGVLVDITSENLVIISAFPDSPAEKAGLRAGDTIIGVDGEIMTGVDGSVVISKILGPAGTPVLLTILREGEEEPFEVELTRQNIELPSVTSRMLEDDLGYIHLNTFGIETTEELREAIQSLLDEGAKGLVVDVRNNGGGLLTTSVEVTSEFVGEGVVLYQEYGDGSLETHEVVEGGLATEIPMVLLVNGGSASASEILAGSIQDNGRASVIGETTFGKGSVQQTIQLSEDGDAVRITTARWLTPDKRQISEIGIIPDIEVLLSEEDLESETDIQLEKAIEVLLSQIRGG